LQGTSGDIGEWTPYHDIVIYHHISLYIVFFFLMANKYINKKIFVIKFRVSIFNNITGTAVRFLPVQCCMSWSWRDMSRSTSLHFG
jgi:hypothetical protein